MRSTFSEPFRRPGEGRVRLALLAAAPMHYQVPLYRRLAADPRIDFTAIFASDAGVRARDLGYSQPIAWDADLLTGYRSIFLKRASKNAIGYDFFDLVDIDVISVVQSGNYDVLWIHGYNFATMQLAAMAQLLRGGRLLFREEQTLIHARPPWKERFKSIWLRSLFTKAAALYLGAENKRWFSRFGIPADRMFFTPYCVENHQLQALSRQLRPEKLRLRSEFNVPKPEQPLILTVCRFISKKQPLFLLEAFRRLRQRQACTLLLVGSGELEAQMRKKIEDEDIPDVVFAGFLNQSEVPKAYACADVFALTSLRHETWGIVVNEAMNFALPIVVSNKVGSGTDLVRPGENGYVVSSDDPHETSDALLELVSSEDLRARFGQASLNRISSWTYDVAAAGVLQGVEWAVGEQRWAAARQDALAAGA
jgi:glycosyltransferase involved in cell wall biosynthesis